MEAKLAENQNPDTVYTPILKKAVEHLKSIKESDRVKFNELFMTVMQKVKDWGAAGMKLD